MDPIKTNIKFEEIEADARLEVEEESINAEIDAAAADIQVGIEDEEDPLDIDLTNMNSDLEIEIEERTTPVVAGVRDVKVNGASVVKNHVAEVEVPVRVGQL